MSLQHSWMHFTKVLGICALVSPISSALATTIFNNGGINIVNGPSDDIQVSNGPGDSSTIVHVTAGADVGIDADDRSLTLAQQSVLLFSGGGAQGSVLIADDSIAFLLGTAVVSGDFEVEDNGELQLADDALVEGDVVIADDATAGFFGGTVGGETVIEGNAVANINGTTLEDTLVAEGNAVVTVLNATAEDNVEAADDALVHLHDGEFAGSIEAVDNSVVNLLGGHYVAVFSDGEELLADGGTLNVTGGVFGEASGDGDGIARATLSGVINFDGAQIAGADDGTASVATFAAVLNGVVNLSSTVFGDLALEAGNNGEVNMNQIVADDISVHSIAGGVVNINDGTADSLEALVELGGFVNLRGGDFGEIDISLLTDSVLTIYGNSFTYNDTPLDELPDDFFVEETGELKAIGGDLAGVFADGTPFALTYSRQFNPPPGARVFLVQVPEPATVALMLLAAVGLLVNYGRQRGTR